MTRDPKKLRYATTHEWVDVEGEIATIGISAFAVAELTDLVFMALPEVGKTVTAGEEFGEVESVKAVSPLYAPVSGEVIEAHEKLADDLESLGSDAYDNGWFIKVKMSSPAEADSLMDFEQYTRQCEG